MAESIKRSGLKQEGAIVSRTADPCPSHTMMDETPSLAKGHLATGSAEALPSTQEIAVSSHSLEATTTDLVRMKSSAPQILLGGAPESRRSAWVSAKVKALALAKAGYSCKFAGEDGHRCASRLALQLDHIVPRAHGGPGSIDNIQVLCRAHNIRKAEHDMGALFIQEKIKKSRPAPHRD